MELNLRIFKKLVKRKFIEEKYFDKNFKLKRNELKQNIMFLCEKKRKID